MKEWRVPREAVLSHVSPTPQPLLSGELRPQAPSLSSSDLGLSPAEARCAAGTRLRAERPRPPGRVPARGAAAAPRLEPEEQVGATAPPPRPGSTRAGGRGESLTPSAARSAARPQRRRLDLGRCGTEPGARSRRRRGHRRSSSPVRPPVRPAAGSASARASGWAPEGGGARWRCGRPASPGAEWPPAGAGLLACPRPGDPRRPASGLCSALEPAASCPPPSGSPPGPAVTGRGGNGVTAALSGDFPGPTLR